MTADRLMRELFEWWQERTDAERAIRLFHETVVVDTLVGGPVQEWIRLETLIEPMENVTVIAKAADSSRAAMLFEGVDPVAGVRHRISWFLTASEGRITSFALNCAIAPSESA